MNYPILAASLALFSSFLTSGRAEGQLLRNLSNRFCQSNAECVVQPYCETVVHDGLCHPSPAANCDYSFGEYVATSECDFGGVFCGSAYTVNVPYTEVVEQTFMGTPLGSVGSGASGVIVGEVVSDLGNNVINGIPATSVVQNAVYVPSVDENTKQEIRDIKIKLNRIQDGETPNVNEIRDEIDKLRKTIEKLIPAESSSNGSTTSVLDGLPRDNGFPVQQMRTWTDSSGRYTVSAKLIITTKTGNVILLKQNGKRCLVSLSSLSDQERDFIASAQDESPAHDAIVSLSR